MMNEPAIERLPQASKAESEDSGCRKPMITGRALFVSKEVILHKYLQEPRREPSALEPDPSQRVGAHQTEEGVAIS